MAEIQISAERHYVVRITGDWRGDLSPWMSKRERVAVIFSSAMSGVIPEFNSQSSEVTFIEIPDGEAGKSQQTLAFIWEQLGRNGFTRSDLIVAIGGGTVTDVAGFAAATWLRGIDWLAIPTTLAGMVDASVGGKTGINSQFGKNLIGAFHSPIAVIIDSNWLKTLSDRDFSAGLAEVIKCGFINDREILDLTSGKSLGEIRSQSPLVTALIEKSVSTKAKVVSEDFRESQLREILNYGHTFGHAIERVSDYSIRHGEAVAIGMVFIAELSHFKGLIDQELVDLHRQILSQVGLPTNLARVAGGGNWPALYAAMSLDKKARGSNIRFVALEAIGECTRIEDVSEQDLKAVYEKVLA